MLIEWHGLPFLLYDPARSLSWALEGKAQEDNPWERRQGRPALACRFKRSGSPFSLRPERFRARFIRFRARFARPEGRSGKRAWLLRHGFRDAVGRLLVLDRIRHAVVVGVDL